VLGTTPTTITLGLCLPPGEYQLKRAVGSPVLLEQCANPCILSDPRLFTINVQSNGAPRPYVDGFNIYPATTYFYRFITICGNEWVGEQIVAVTTPINTPATLASNVTVTSATVPDVGLLNLAVNVANLPTPILGPLYYLLNVAGGSALVTVTPGPAPGYVPSINVAWSGTQPAPLITAAVNACTLSLSLTNITTPDTPPTSFTITQTGANGTPILGPSTIPITY